MQQAALSTKPPSQTDSQPTSVNSSIYH